MADPAYSSGLELASAGERKAHLIRTDTSTKFLTVSMLMFVDFDGVLHPEPCYDEIRLFCHRERFEAVLRDFPDIDVVISSMWRQKHSLEELRGLFSTDIGLRIIDVTPHWSTVEHLFDVIGTYERHVEIEAWRRRTGRIHEYWIALDDKPYWFRPFLKNLVVCDSAIGFDADAEQRLRAKLQGVGRNRDASLKRSPWQV